MIKDFNFERVQPKVPVRCYNWVALSQGGQIGSSPRASLQNVQRSSIAHHLPNTVEYTITFTWFFSRQAGHIQLESLLTKHLTLHDTARTVLLELGPDPVTSGRLASLH